MNTRAAALLSGVALAVLAVGCGPSPAVPARTEAAAPVALHEGPLTDYVPAAGLRWLVVGHPKALADDPAIVAALSRLFPDEKLTSFAQGTGVELRRLPSGLVAGFDYATLYMASSSNGSDIAARFRERSLVEAKVHAPHPGIQRISGMVGQTPEVLVVIEGTLVAVSVGDPTPARVVELFALGKLKRSPAALEGSALSTLPLQELEPYPVRFYAPGPFEGEWSRGAGGLLGAALALAVVARPLDGKRLEAQVVLSGDWNSPDLRERLEAAWKSLATSRLGTLLNLHRPLGPPDISVTPTLLRLRVELELIPLVNGLHAAVAADVWQMMELPSKNNSL